MLEHLNKTGLCRKDSLETVQICGREAWGKRHQGLSHFTLLKRREEEQNPTRNSSRETVHP